MKMLFLVAAASALLLPPLADARDWRPGFGARLQAQGQQTKKGPSQSQRGRRDLQRGERGERDERHHGRLTEEERRELHRDLDRADREIYRRHPPR
ncbi:MAG: hypothetical protein HYU76_06560 [Betaproteobacteria bacterium]|nr:hypothetical protein [Betaproteobacteria bacterium]